MRQCFVDCSRTLLRGRGRLHGAADVDADLDTYTTADDVADHCTDTNSNDEPSADAAPEPSADTSAFCFANAFADTKPLECLQRTLVFGTRVDERRQLWKLQRLWRE